MGDLLSGNKLHDRFKSISKKITTKRKMEMKTRERLIGDVYLLLNYFGGETQATHSDILTKIHDIAEYWPDGMAHFDGLVNAVTSVYLNKDDPMDMSGTAAHLQAYFCGTVTDDGVWEGKLKRLVEADPDALEAALNLVDAAVTVWANEHQ